MKKKSSSSRQKSSAKKRPTVRVRDLKPTKDVSGGRTKLGDIKGEY